MKKIMNLIKKKLRHKECMIFIFNCFFIYFS